MRPSPDAPRIVFLGDSLTAGWGVRRGNAFPELLQQQLLRHGFDYQCVNAGVPGDTMRGGLARCGAYLAPAPWLVIVQFGANDLYLRVPLSDVRSHLAGICRKVRAVEGRLLLAGISIPSFPADLVEGLAVVHRETAEEFGACLLPNLVDGLGAGQGLYQADTVHPNEQGHERMADNCWPHLRGLVVANG